MSEKRSVFREVALERLSTPEQLDQLIQVTSPRSWLALGAIGTLLTGLLLWAYFGTVTTRVEGECVLFSSDLYQRLNRFGSQDIEMQRDILDSQRRALEQAVSDARARVQELNQRLPTERKLLAQGLITGGQLRATEQLLADTRQALERDNAGLKQLSQRELAASFGREGELAGRAQIAAGSSPEPTEHLQAVVYVATADGKRVTNGMEIRVAPASFKPEEHGYMLGRISAVAEFPATTTSMMRVLRNDQLVTQLSQTGAPFEVVADLEVDPGSPSGYRWTSAGGPDSRVQSGTPCTARIAVQSQRPVELVVPAIRKALKLY